MLLVLRGRWALRLLVTTMGAVQLTMFLSVGFTVSVMTTECSTFIGRTSCRWCNLLSAHETEWMRRVNLHNLNRERLFFFEAKQRCSRQREDGGPRKRKAV